MGKFNTIKKSRKTSSSNIDEKIEYLNKELKKTGTLFEDIPVNNTSQLYMITPSYDEIDTVVVEQDPILNFEQEDNPTDTTGIFDVYGNSLVEDPPGTWSSGLGGYFDNQVPGAIDEFGLGPMVSYYDSGSNTTNLGYIRSSDRSMINLGRITGTMESWNGSSNFTSYGYLTLAQAQWFKDKVTSGNTTDYRVFYSGITDPSDPDGRVNAKVVSTPKPVGSVNKMSASTFDNQFSSTTPINITFYRYTYGVSSGDREVIFYDSNTGSAPTNDPYLGSPVDSYTFTVPQPVLLRSLRSSPPNNSFMVGNVGLKWTYPLGEPDGDLTGSYPEDYLNYSMVINGKEYPLPGLGGVRAAIGIPGYSKGWKNPPVNSKNGKLSGPYNITTKIPAVHSGPDPNLVPGSARPKKKGELSDADLYKFGLYRGSDGKLHKIPNDKPTPYDAADPVNLAFNSILARLGIGSALAFQKWANLGKNQRIPNEDAASLERLWADDLKQRGQSDAAFARGDEPPLFGRPDQAFNPFRPAEKGGPGSGPTPAIRQIFGRGVKPSTAASGESKNKQKTQKNSYNPQGQFLSESRKRIARDIKNPVVVPEPKQEKVKHRPRVVGAPPRTIGADLMKQAEVPTSFKPMEDKMWGKYEKRQNARASQERKNQVLDYVGTSDHAWEWITEKIQNNSKDVMYGNFDIKKHMGIESDKVKGKIVRIEQTKDNDALFYFQDSESGKTTVMKQSEFDGILNEEKKEVKQDDYTDNLYRKSLKKIGYNFDYSDRPSKNGYPDVPPPEMVNGWHPEYGQKDAYYNKLDPQSADSMPSTGNTQIDANVKRAKTLKKVLGKKA